MSRGRQHRARTLVRVGKGFAEDLEDRVLGPVRQVLASAEDNVRKTVDNRVANVAFLRRSEVRELGDERVDSRLVDHKDSQRRCCAVANRQTRGVGERLDERSLELGEEGLDELRDAGEEDGERGEDGGFDGGGEAVSDDTNCG